MTFFSWNDVYNGLEPDTATIDDCKNAILYIRKPHFLV